MFSYDGRKLVTLSMCLGIVFYPVTLNSEMDFYLRNGRNGDFFYEMELQNSILVII